MIFFLFEKMFGPVDPYRTKCLFTLGCSFESIDDLRTAFLTLKDKSREQSFLQTAAACFEHELFMYMESDRFDTKNFCGHY